MFARIFALLPLAALVAADYQCNTGSPNCCNTVGSPSSPAVLNGLEALGKGGLLGTLGAAVGALVGLQCTAIAGQGANCAQEPVCCENNEGFALVNIECSPINIL